MLHGITGQQETSSQDSSATEITEMYPLISRQEPFRICQNSLRQQPLLTINQEKESYKSYTLKLVDYMINNV